MRGWRNTVDIVLFEISNSMKPYPSVHAYSSKMGPVIGFFEPRNVDEVSNGVWYLSTCVCACTNVYIIRKLSCITSSD